MKFKLAYIVAMQEEAQEYINRTNATMIESKPFKIFKTDDILVGVTGVGLINASIAFAYIDKKYNPTKYVNVGLTGSIDSTLEILECVVIEKLYHAASDATCFGYQYGQTPKEEPFYSMNNSLFEIFEKNYKDKYSKRNLASSDVFLDTQEKWNLIASQLPDSIKLFDMESFGLFQAAFKFEKPILSVKWVSDILNFNGPNKEQFLEVVLKGSNKIATFMQEFRKWI